MVESGYLQLADFMDVETTIGLIEGDLFGTGSMHDKTSSVKDTLIKGVALKEGRGIQRKALKVFEGLIGMRYKTRIL